MRLSPHVLVACLVVTAVVAATGCHPAPEVALPGSRSDVITRDELDSAGNVSVYDAIIRRHANFFRSRGPTSINSTSAPRAWVFMAEQAYGEIETLRNIPAERVESIKYYSGTDAATKFGKIYNGGVIQLIPRYQ
jgi:hypothetical protein